VALLYPRSLLSRSKANDTSSILAPVSSSAAPYTKSYAPGPIGSVPALELRNANLNVRTNVTASANVFATDYGVSNLANAFGSMDLIEASPIRMDMSPAQLVLHMLAPPTPPK
jgi:hypothetical protein